MADILRILYVEDNPADIQLLLDLLREVPGHGLEIFNRESLREARLTGNREMYDAVLLDLNLPDSTGLATFQAISRLYPGLPVIIFTVTDLEDMAVEAVRAGAQDYLVKGQLTGQVVLRAIRHAIERKALNRQLALANEMLESRIAERTRELAQANEALREEVEERRRRELDIKEQRQLLQDILDGLQAAVLFVDVESYKIVDANPLAERLLGLQRGEIVGKACYRLICGEPRDTPPEVCPALGRKSLHVDFTLRRTDGSSVPAMKTVLASTINGRKHHIAILIDISERKALERKLALAQKLEAIGQLAAGIAHEINTPAQYIGSNVDYFAAGILRLGEVVSAYAALEKAVRAGRNAMPEADAVREALDRTDLPGLLEELPQALADCKDGVERITTIVQAMKQFSHPDTETKMPVDVNAAVQNTLAITRNEWKYASEVTSDLAPKLPPVFCVPGDFNQVLLNVIVNAAQANAAKFKGQDAKGRIHVTTSRSGDRVMIHVEDTGVGIPPGIQDRIFDPFFTTKGIGEGTGQGLCIVHSILKRYGGSIRFTSTEGVGATFTLSMPIAQSAKEVEGMCGGNCDK